MNPARFRWGILFILVGTLLILNNFRYLDWWVWEDILSLWPLILIAIGVEKIFAKSKMQFIAYLAPLALAAAVLFVAFNGYYNDTKMSRYGNSYRYNLEMKPEYKNAEVDFDLDEVDMTLRHTETNELFRARFGSLSGQPSIEIDEQGGDVKLKIDESNHRRGVFFFDDSHSYRDHKRWTAYLTNTLPIKLNCVGDESDMRLDCRELKIENLSVRSDRGDINVSLGKLVDFIKVTLDGDNAEFNVFLPLGSGVKVIGANDDINRRCQRIGLIESGDAFVSEGYDTLSPKIELDMSKDISQFSLDFY